MNINSSIHALFRKLGFDVVRYNADHFASVRRAHIIRHNRIDVVLDVGANEGAYGVELRNLGYTGKIVSFEPLTEPFDLLKRRSDVDRSWTSLNVAIGDFDGEAQINVSGHQTSSSLLEILERHTQALPSSAIVDRRNVSVTRLDTILRDRLDPANRLYLKADVQGFEKKVLEGAGQVMEQVIAVEVELSLVSMYEGAPLYLDMISSLQDLGFQLVSISGMFSDSRSSYVLQADGIFVRS